MFLAKQHGFYEIVLKILLEDLNQAAAALEYIHTLEFTAAERSIKQYGKVLMNDVPEQTTELLKELCSTYNRQKDTAPSLFPLDSAGIHDSLSLSVSLSLCLSLSLSLSVCLF
jgi:hypothetical protein